MTAPAGLRLVLLRHGRTGANVRRALDTAPPGEPLDELGESQAAAVAEVLAGWPVRAVHASTAIRAQQTAAPVAAAHGLDVEVVDGVQEVFAGALEGRADEAARAAFEEIYAAWWGGDLQRTLPGGESALQVRARFLAAIEQIMTEQITTEPTVTEPEAGAVVLVSHGAAIRLSVAALLGDTAETRYVPNTGRVVLARTPDVPTGWTCELWDTGPPVPGDVTAGALAPG